jgi:hypothetical protein
MIIIYQSDGKILQAIWNKDRSFISSHPHLSIEIDETQNNKPELIKLTQEIGIFDDPNYDVQGGVLYFEGSPVSLDTDNYYQTIKSEYISTINQLTALENASSLSNAQVLNAIKGMARILRLLLRLLRQLFFNGG